MKDRTENTPVLKKRPVRIGLRVVGYILVIYVLLCVGMYFMQEIFIYVPNRNVQSDPSAVGIDFEDIYLEVPGGGKINAWYMPAENSRRALLFCHGNGGNMAWRLQYYTLFHDLGFNLLTFDYRGYGRSEGSPSEENTYEDARAAWKYLVEDKGFSPEDTVIYGRSLGGGVAARLAFEKKPGALALESTFTSMADKAREMMPFLPVSLILKHEYPTKEIIGKMECPVLILHSPEDDLIPFSHGRTNFALAKDPKKFVEVSGIHNTVLSGSYQVIRSALSEFRD